MLQGKKASPPQTHRGYRAGGPPASTQRVPPLPSRTAVRTAVRNPAQPGPAFPATRCRYLRRDAGCPPPRGAHLQRSARHRPAAGREVPAAPRGRGRRGLRGLQRSRGPRRSGAAAGGARRGAARRRHGLISLAEESEPPPASPGPWLLGTG